MLRGPQQNKIQEVRDGRQEQQQQQHLRKRPHPLSISTRSVGLAVGEFIQDLKFALWDNRICQKQVDKVSSTLYRVYRLFLFVFESKLYRSQRFSGLNFLGYHGQLIGRTDVGTLPKHITEIVNALGVIDYEGHTLVPVVADEVKDANGKLVPQPLSLLYSNLRRAVVALADPETPEQYRIDFEAYCPIPGAIWQNHLLMNADEIIPDNHSIDHDFAACYYVPESMRGTLNDDTRGKISGLVNINGMREFKLRARQVEESILEYNAESTLDRFNDLNFKSSFAKLSDDQINEGLDVLMFGEVPNNADHQSKLYAIRGKWVNAFNVPGYTDESLCCESVCLTLSVTTRGIGIFFSWFLHENQRLLKKVTLDIYATYRAFLGLFEIKLKPNWLCTRLKFSETYRSSFVRTNPNLTSTMVISVPEPINRIISAVGNITIGQRTFVMAMASERLDKNGKPIPEPQHLLISNLRKTVEALSDPETPLEHREHFERNCPIPGAIWDNHLLANADEIIPANYTAVDLEADILAWVECASELKGLVTPRLTELTLNGGGGDALGKRSAMVAVTMEHPLCVEPRQVGQELAAYVPDVRLNDRLEFRSFVGLTPQETAEGQTLMLGEWPKGETRPIYALRDPVVCGFDVVQNMDLFYMLGWDKQRE